MTNIRAFYSVAGLFPALAFLLAVSSGCSRRSSEEEDSKTPEPAVVSVKTAAVYRGIARATVSVTGKTDALRKEKVFSPVPGWIISLKALEGTHVRKGEVMAVIRPKEAQAAIAGARSLLERARTPAQEEEARKAMALAESGQNAVELRASFDGVVGTRTVTEGELIGENAELFTIVDLSTLVFLADIPLAALSNVREGESADIQFTGLPDRSFRGTVEAMSPQSDPQSQTVRARIRFAGSVPALLRTEMAGTARIVTAVHPRALLIPRSALLHDDEHDISSVIVVTGDTIARVLPVTVGALSDSVAEITSGSLQPGMRVVVEGNYALADSTRVSLAGDGSQ